MGVGRERTEWIRTSKKLTTSFDKESMGADVSIKMSHMCSNGRLPIGYEMVMKHELGTRAVDAGTESTRWIFFAKHRS
jgi:hypothetical protein